MTVTDYLLIANLAVLSVTLALTIKESVERHRKKKEDNFPFPPTKH